MLEASWNVIAHAQKPDFVFRRNGQVHLNRRGRQFNRLLAAEVCASANAGYNMFRGSVKGTGYTLHSPVTPSIPLLCVIVCHHISVTVCHRISTGIYIRCIFFSAAGISSDVNWCHHYVFSFSHASINLITWVRNLRKSCDMSHPASWPALATTLRHYGLHSASVRRWSAVSSQVYEGTDWNFLAHVGRPARVPERIVR
jgi:hypothetical protein